MIPIPPIVQNLSHGSHPTHGCRSSRTIRYSNTTPPRSSARRTELRPARLLSGKRMHGPRRGWRSSASGRIAWRLRNCACGEAPPRHAIPRHPCRPRRHPSYPATPDLFFITKAYLSLPPMYTCAHRPCTPPVHTAMHGPSPRSDPRSNPRSSPHRAALKAQPSQQPS